MGLRARVVNPELTREMDILEAAGLFELTNEDVPVVIELKSLRLVPRDANPLDVFKLFALGLAPMSTTDSYIYEFFISFEGTLKYNGYAIEVKRTVSFWELLRGSPEVDEVLADGLRSAILDEQRESSH